jgi:hypothetical protein
VGSGFVAEADHGIEGIEMEEQPPNQVAKSRASRMDLNVLIELTLSAFAIIYGTAI